MPSPARSGQVLAAAEAGRPGHGDMIP